MAEAKKKKLIRIKSRMIGGGYGMNGGTNFAFSSAPDENGDRYQAGDVMTCREYFNRSAYDHVNKKDGMHYEYGQDTEIDMEKLRFLVLKEDTIEEYKQKLFNAKAALNRLEEMAEFESTSKITTVVHEKYENAWLITGPGEWLSQPQLLSLATWLIRVVTIFGPINIDSYDSVEESLRMMVAKRNKINSTASDISEYAMAYWDKMYILLKYRDDIFKHMDSLEKSYSLDDGKSFMRDSGMYVFLSDEVNYTEGINEASTIFRDLCKEFLPRENPLKGTDLNLWYCK